MREAMPRLSPATGINRGGHSSKLHALADGEGRPFRFLLTDRLAGAQPNNPAPRYVKRDASLLTALRVASVTWRSGFPRTRKFSVGKNHV
jgi:hypothetical protein